MRPWPLHTAKSGAVRRYARAGDMSTLRDQVCSAAATGIRGTVPSVVDMVGTGHPCQLTRPRACHAWVRLQSGAAIKPTCPHCKSINTVRGAGLEPLG